MAIFFHLYLLSKSDSDKSRIESSSNIISPEVILPPNNILMIAKPNVVFPQALSPAIPIDSPLFKLKSTSSNAKTLPFEVGYTAERPFIDKNAI